MDWMQLPLGPLQTNCYIVKKDGICLIIDPGEEGKRIIVQLNKLKLTPKAILLTHAHFDHIGAVDYIRDHYNIPVYIHEKEAKWLLDPALNGSQFFSIGHLVRIKPADNILYKEEIRTIEDFEMQIFETPGHSPGSVSFFFANERVVLCGDALFKGSIGRTDLPGGNHQQLLRSIREKLLTLPEDTIVLSGHGDTTTIREEIDSNPFLQGV